MGFATLIHKVYQSSDHRYGFVTKHMSQCNLLCFKITVSSSLILSFNILIMDLQWYPVNAYIVINHGYCNIFDKY